MGPVGSEGTIILIKSLFSLLIRLKLMIQLMTSGNKQQAKIDKPTIMIFSFASVIIFVSGHPEIVYTKDFFNICFLDLFVTLVFPLIVL